ncbi:MAG: hypothetical protein WDO69_09220 [Pseudomonadota bacterium]
MPEFVRTLKVHGAPRPGFSLVAELLVGVSEQSLGYLVPGSNPSTLDQLGPEPAANGHHMEPDTLPDTADARRRSQHMP